MQTTPIAYLTRKESFSASHRLHSPMLSEAVNEQIYGKCNNPNGHGHNYNGKYIILEVTIRGPIDKNTGMVMNITDLKEHMDNVIMKKLDHKNLDKDVSYFENLPSTTENVAVYIFNHLKTRLPSPELLYEVKIQETDKNSVIYRGKIGARKDTNGSRKIHDSISSDSD
ncbi:6-pyruvoyl tetrahydrobiopterin synthase [Pseudolycoriella hygida]|uniref:6-pyruvoyl tetrahydrobiopterin synthase n=1 Tax=Pseudolycoriella hygida TaxID=35572 RepID=A0A9Q0S609_9DIPT|nr:6-pyruvoyl tetrahydrobiopterin synthase [Pseudolycoriella hygida]